MSELRLEIITQIPPADLEWVRGRLNGHNDLQVGADDFRWLAVFLRDESQQRQGALIGWTMWSWMHIDHLWIEPDCRAQGHGRRLLQAAEAEAMARGCTFAETDTFSFQAPEFYKKAGYQEFGRLTGIAGGIERIYLRKDLKPPAA